MQCSPNKKKRYSTLCDHGTVFSNDRCSAYALWFHRKLCGGHEAASEGLVGEEWGLEEGLEKCGRWHLEVEGAMMRGLGVI